MQTLLGLRRSIRAKEMRRKLERAFPHAQFKVQIYENDKWDVWYSNNMIGRELELAEVLKDDNTVQWYENRKTKQRVYLEINDEESDNLG